MLMAASHGTTEADQTFRELSVDEALTREAATRWTGRGLFFLNQDPMQMCWVQKRKKNLFETQVERKSRAQTNFIYRENMCVAALVITAVCFANPYHAFLATVQEWRCSFFGSHLSDCDPPPSVTRADKIEFCSENVTSLLQTNVIERKCEKWRGVPPPSPSIPSASDPSVASFLSPHSPPPVQGWQVVPLTLETTAKRKDDEAPASRTVYVMSPTPPSSSPSPSLPPDK